MRDEFKICCICGNSYLGYGNYAMPVKDGYCCDKCHSEQVIPARFKALKSKENQNG
jgi:hypothetical protein